MTKHVHRCPVCRADSECFSAECEAVLEDEYGVPMLFKTCETCMKRLSKETTKQPLAVGGVKKWGS